MSKNTITALGYLEIGVSNLADWRTYANTVLGVEVIEAEDALHLRYDDHAWRIRVVETGEDDIRCAGFETDSVEALQALGAHLENLGFEVTNAPAEAATARRADHLLRCSDPFGLAVELYAGDRSTHGPLHLPEPGNTFVTEGQGLGHIVLSVADQEAAEKFYMQGLGMRLSDHIFMGPPGRQIQLTFLHCNPRHHTLALAPVPAPKRLNHIMLEVGSLDEVGYGLERAQNAGVAISSSLGKHTNDKMVSFYMQTPSGFDIEYGFGGIAIDDATWTPTSFDATSYWGHKGALR